MLRKRWGPLGTRTVGKAPEAYDYYEPDDANDDLVGRGAGVLRGKLKKALAYGDARCVRWECATPLNHAERLTDEHDPA